MCVYTYITVLMHVFVAACVETCRHTEVESVWCAMGVLLWDTILIESAQTAEGKLIES